MNEQSQDPIEKIEQDSAQVVAEIDAENQTQPEVIKSKLYTRKELREKAKKLSIQARMDLIETVEDLRLNRGRLLVQNEDLLSQVNERLQDVKTLDQMVQNRDAHIKEVSANRGYWMDQSNSFEILFNTEKGQHEKTKADLETYKKAYTKLSDDFSQSHRELSRVVDERDGYHKETLSLKSKIFNLEDLNTRLQKSGAIFEKQVKNLRFMAKKLKSGWMKTILNQ